MKLIEKHFQLQQNGRTTSGVTKSSTIMGTKKRLEKLINQKTIKISALINTDSLGLIPAIVMLEMENIES